MVSTGLGRSVGILTTLALTVLLPAAGLSAAVAPPADAGPPRDGGRRQPYIVVLEEGENADAAARRFEVRYGSAVRHVYEAALDGYAATMTDGEAAAVARQRGVARVEPDGTVAAVGETYETGPNGILRTSSWNAHQDGHDGRTLERAKVRVVVLDTGVNAAHTDLAPNLDTANGIDCITPGTAPDDDQGHGTHVMGTAGASFRGTGVVGVATDVELVAGKVLDATGYGSDSEVICGLDHAVALAADGLPTIVNFSLGEERTEDWAGLGCTSSAMHQAVCNATAVGVTVVAAAGNSGTDAAAFVPAAFPEAIAVSALTDFDGERSFAGCQTDPTLTEYFYECDDHLASFSNYGSVVDVAAPGVWIYSTTMDGGWATKTGTSMAAPHVAGAAALVRAANPALSPVEVREVLRATGECPNGAQADTTGTCAGKGQWQVGSLFGNSADPDGIAEPLMNSQRAAAEAYRRSHVGGDWVGVYGADGHALAAWDGTADLVDLPATLTVEQGSRVQWTATTTGLRALQSPDATSRRAAAWTDATEVRLRLDFTNVYRGTLHLYALDWPDTNRRQQIDVTQRGLTTTNLLPFSFDDGAWVHVPIKVARGDSLTITVRSTTAHESILSGLFLGEAPMIDPYPEKPLDEVVSGGDSPDGSGAASVSAANSGQEPLREGGQ